MQDEVNTKVVAIMIKGGKISAEVLKKALDKFVQEIEKAQKQMQQPKTYRGKQSIKHLMSQNAAISNIEVTDGNIKSFERVARKYNVDFAVKKDKTVEPPKYARNKNILVIGGSGSGKTRFFVKPNLMQMHSSYVVTDPKG